MRDFFSLACSGYQGGNLVDWRRCIGLYPVCGIVCSFRVISHPSLFVFRSIHVMNACLCADATHATLAGTLHFIAANLAHQRVPRASRQISQAPLLPSRKSHLASPRRVQAVSRQASPRRSLLAAPRVTRALIRRASRRRKTYP